MKRSTQLIALACLVGAASVAVWRWPRQADAAPVGTCSAAARTPAQHARLTPTRRVNWLARWRGEHDREKLVREAAREFEFLNPDVRLNFKFHQDVGLPNEKCVAAKIAEMIRSGDIEWDIVPLNTGQYRDVAELLDDPHWGRKHLVDFTDAEWFAAAHKSFITSDPIYRQPFDGMFVGPYIEGFYCMLWCNRDVARQLGLEIKRHGMTIDDFIRCVRAVSEYNQTHDAPLVAIQEAKDWRTTEYLFRYLFASAVGTLEEVAAVTPSERKGAALLRTFEALEELGAYAPLGDEYDTRTWWDTRGEALDGRVLFVVNGSWMYSHWMAIDPAATARMAPAELPVFQPVDFYIGGYTPEFAVMKNSPNAETAVQLLRSWTQPRAAERWVRYTKAPTGLRGNLSQSDVANDPFELFQREMNEKYQGALHFSDDVGFILGEENKLLVSEVNEQVVRLLAGKTTAQEAYAAILSQCK